MLEKVPERVQEKIREDIPLGRFATTEDIVGMIRFLVGDQTEYMTGQVLDQRWHGRVAIRLDELELS